jgi:hypothetical protein
VSDRAEFPANLIDLQAAWRRRGRILAGETWEEPSDVLWLQAGRHFCDLRTPRAGTTPVSLLDQRQGFSGMVRVNDGAISFHHDLDTLPRDPAHPDQGTVHRAGDAMYERGPGFEECWVVDSKPEDDVVVAVCHQPQGGGALLVARLVRVGPSALAIWAGDTPGGAEYHEQQGWQLVRTVGGKDPVQSVLAITALGTGQPLPSGWVVVDHQLGA